MLTSLSAVGVFVLTLTLVIRRPRGLPVGVAALLGAVLAFTLGLVGPDDVRAVWAATWNATLTLIGLILLSLTLDRAGLFRFLALHLVRLCRGRTPVLFVLLVLFAAVLAALLANDGAVLILTPITLELCVLLGLPRVAALALLFAVGFTVDAASLPLVTSNLTNIISADLFGFDATTYARVMLPVNAAAVAATLAVLWLAFGRHLRTRFDPAALPSPGTALRDRRVCGVGPVLLAVTLAGFLWGHHLGLPESAVVLLAAVVLLGVAAPGRVVRVDRVVREAPWDVVLFSLGMYLVVYGLRDAGLVDAVSRLLENLAAQGPWATAFGTGLLTTLGSAVSNNLPAVLVGALAIEGAAVNAATRDLLVYANVVGGNIGPKLTPIGSLATLLWLHLLAGRGYRLSWREYLGVGALTTLPVLLAALAALVVSVG